MSSNVATWLAGAALVPAALATTAGLAASGPAPASSLYTCGRSSVVESRLDTSDAHPVLRPVWTWTAAGSLGMPAELAGSFSTIDECKPTANRDEILVTSSHDAVAIVSRKDGSTLFAARVKNAHSAVLLPHGVLAAAASDAADGTGDRIFFFDRHRPAVPIAEQPLSASHGLVWDRTRKILWAEGRDRLLKLTLRFELDGALGIDLRGNYPLPEPVGHDLRMSEDCRSLYLSTTHHVFAFDISGSTFVGWQPLADIVDVKSLSIQPGSGAIAYTAADPGGYWTSTLRFEHPHADVALPEPIYKVRWTDDFGSACQAP